MALRIVTSLLWFIAIDAVWEFAAVVFNLPHDPAPIIGAAIGAFVLLDPGGLVWQKQKMVRDVRRRIARELLDQDATAALGGKQPVAPSPGSAAPAR